MLKITKNKDDLYVGIDHSVNKSAICVINGMGNIIEAALFEKSKSSHKYTFTYLGSDQKKIKEDTIKVKEQKPTKKYNNSSSIFFLEKENEYFLSGEKNFESEVISDGLKSGLIYDDGEYTRTALICEAIRDFLKGFSQRKLHIVIEGYAFFAPGNIVLIAENIGYLKILLVKEYWGFEMVQPNSIKLALTGFGGGGKDSMQFALKNKYGVDFNNDDLNDAFAMAEYSRLKAMGLVKSGNVS